MKIHWSLLYVSRLPFPYIKALIVFADTWRGQQPVSIKSGDEMTDAETMEQPGLNPKALKNS